MTSRSLLIRLGSLLALGALVACAAEASPRKAKKQVPYDPSDTFGYEEEEQEASPLEAISEADSGAFGPASARPNQKEGGVDAGPTDGGAKVTCAGTLAKGDLAVVEIMIASRSGSGDDGEWLEVQNTRDCWLKVKDVIVESPRGALINAAVVSEDLELAPKASFLVGGSAAKSMAAGKVYVWDTTDVLKNDGDTVTVRIGNVVIDQLTFPSFGNLEPGRALAFPADCPASARSDWSRWSLAFDVFGGKYKGTPNIPNVDVTCF